MKKRPKKIDSTRVIGYCRVSTEEQADEGASLAAQQEKIVQYAKTYELELVDMHVDAGASAKTLDRPALQTALSDLRTGQAGGLVVVKLDRLTRSIRGLQDLLDDYFREKYALMSVSDHFDTRTANGRMMMNFFNMISEWEREIIAERTKEVLQHLKSKGVRLGRDPLGWERTGELDAEGRMVFKEVPEEQQTLKLILLLRQQGHSLASIAETLATKGIATKRGGAWGAQTISDMLKRAKEKQ